MRSGINWSADTDAATLTLIGIVVTRERERERDIERERERERERDFLVPHRYLSNLPIYLLTYLLIIYIPA